AFMRQGFATTSVDEVAKLIGATKGSVYYYFRNKTELFCAVHRRAMDMNLGAIRPLAQGPGTPRQRLAAMVEAHAMLMLTALPYQRVTVQGLEMNLLGRTTAGERSLLMEIVALRDEYEALFRQVLAEGMAAGEFRQGDPRLVVKPLLGALNWTALWYEPRPRETAATRRRLAAGIARFALAGAVGIPE
ncbi:MAG: TetR/AcrR family transcriptional regulator, partial [Acetobacteraceae bacterium]|nr:TetR/AcrR family transcriptional regulator [Acetobacteraceae bacterium]